MYKYLVWIHETFVEMGGGSGIILPDGRKPCSK